MELSSEECLQLKLLLVDSNRSLPPAQRIASGYNVSKTNVKMLCEIPYN